jgi:voltage-gated potassium channel Kch
MRTIPERLFLTLAVAGTAFLVMGADKAAVKVSGSAPSSVTSKTTASVVTKTTGSVPNGAAAGVVSKGTGTWVTLSPGSEELARTIKFDRQVLIMVKEETQEHLQRLIGYDEDDYQIMAPGVAVSLPEEKTDRALSSLRKKLAPLGYMPFIVEMNAGTRTAKIGVIKGTDPYEILRIMHTDGSDYDISLQDVIARLKEWGKLAPFTIIGADSYWVEIEFIAQPADLKSFVGEVNDFSPDTIEEGPGTLEGLMKEIKRTNRLTLLWE